MQDDGSIPPMSPDDFAALAAFAGPVFQESRRLEAYTSENPIPGTHKDVGSMNIKQGLEQAQRLVQASMLRPPQPIYVPPAVLDPKDLVMGTASFSPYPEPITNVENFPFSPSGNPPISTIDPNQLELPFDTSEHKITNDLLREISKKLTKVIGLLEKCEGDDKFVPKLKPNVKQTQI